MGDVVSHAPGDGEAGALAVESVGWREVAPLPAPTDEERAAYRRKMDNWHLRRDGDVVVMIHDEPYDENPRLWDDGADDESSIP